MAESKKEDAPLVNDESLQSEPTSPHATSLQQARKFLKDENVQSASNEKKAEFLKSKGLGDGDIQMLLSEESPAEESSTKSEQTEATNTEETYKEADPKNTIAPVSASIATEAPPIITYPEFLTHSPKPPPLLTPTKLFNTATILTTAWTLAYGAARFIVSPMVETQADSRIEYHEHVNSHLFDLIKEMESVVSEVPQQNGKSSKAQLDSDDDSSYGDPTEMFHRDIGTQTSAPTSDVATSNVGERAVDEQALRLAQLTASLKELSHTYTSQAENSSDLHSSLREFREDVDKLAYPSMPEYSSLYGGSGFGQSSEPEDEIKKTKDAIRSVKGMFLSSRMFPAAAAR